MPRSRQRAKALCTPNFEWMLELGSGQIDDGLMSEAICSILVVVLPAMIGLLCVSWIVSLS